MAKFITIVFVACGFAAGGPALAQNAIPDQPVNPAPEIKKPPRASLDDLFSALEESDPSEAHGLERRIAQRWLESGSDTVDLLMSRVGDAIKEKSLVLALDLLDAVIDLKPDYAEGWNKRATVHFMRKDYGKSIADIETTLALEPRHFGALSGLGMILRELGDKGNALAAFERALEVHPHLKNAKKAVTELEKAVGGRDI